MGEIVGPLLGGGGATAAGAGATAAGAGSGLASTALPAIGTGTALPLSGVAGGPSAIGIGGELGGALGAQLGQSAGAGSSIFNSAAGALNEIPALTGGVPTTPVPQGPFTFSLPPPTNAAGALGGGLPTPAPGTTPPGVLGGQLTGETLASKLGQGLGEFLGSSVDSRLEKFRDAELGPQQQVPLPPLPPLPQSQGVQRSMGQNPLLVQPTPLTLMSLLGGNRRR